MPVSRVQPGYTEQPCTADDKLPRVAVIDSNNSRASIQGDAICWLSRFLDGAWASLLVSELSGVPLPASKQVRYVDEADGGCQQHASLHHFFELPKPLQSPTGVRRRYPTMAKEFFSGYFDFDRPSV